MRSSLGGVQTKSAFSNMPKINQAQKIQNSTVGFSQQRQTKSLRANENYNSDFSGKKLKEKAYPPANFAFKADSNELNENALAQFMAYQNNRKSGTVIIPR